MPINPLRLNDVKLVEENGSGNRDTLKTSANCNLDGIKNEDLCLS